MTSTPLTGRQHAFFVLIIALVAAAMLLPAFGIIERHAAIWYAAFPLSLIIVSRFRTESALYSYLNLFPLLVTLALCVQ